MLQPRKGRDAWVIAVDACRVWKEVGIISAETSRQSFSRHIPSTRRTYLLLSMKGESTKVRLKNKEVISAVVYVPS